MDEKKIREDISNFVADIDSDWQCGDGYTRRKCLNETTKEKITSILLEEINRKTMDDKTRKKLTIKLAEDTTHSEEQAIEELIQEKFDALTDMSEEEFIEEWENFYGKPFNDPTSL